MSLARKKEQLGEEVERKKISEKMFTKFAEKMYQISGVHLPFTPKNESLVQNRIVKLLRTHSLNSFEEYWDYLEVGGTDRISEFTSALTTNMTSFYREESHFEFLTKTLPILTNKFGTDLRIWCAASSTGQEPYTIAITISEAHGETHFSPVRVLATDIDLQVLKKAAAGEYNNREMEGLDPLMRQKYFDKTRTKGEDSWRIKKQVSKLLTFAPFNLMNEQYEFKQKFHVIFCRNVLIYFDDETKNKVVDNLTKALEVGGYLILGHSESGNMRHPRLMPLSLAVFKKI